MFQSSLCLRLSQMVNRVVQSGATAIVVAASLMAAMPALSDQGESVSVQGSFARHSCGYYSSTTGDVLVSYSPEVPLKPGTRVFIHYGWEFPSSARSRSVWSEIVDAQMEPSGSDGSDVTTWETLISQTLHYRSSSHSPIDALDFVFRIEHPNGAVTWEKGLNTEWGYFRVSWDASHLPCLASGAEMPPFEPLDVIAVP